MRHARSEALAALRDLGFLTPSSDGGKMPDGVDEAAVIALMEETIIDKVQELIRSW